MENSLASLGYEGVGHVRIGKHITLEVDTATIEEAQKIVHEVAQRVLSNPVMEDFEVTIVEAELEGTEK